MKIQELPTEVADEVRLGINELHIAGYVSLEKLARLNKWVTKEGYETLTDAYFDWIVADLSGIAAFYFSDAEMLSNIYGPDLEGSTLISDSMRVDFARIFLLFSEHLNIDDSNYPSPVTIELSANNKDATLGVLLHPGGQGGVRPELFGLFRDHADFSNALLSKLYVEIIPSASGDMISDETILGLLGE